MRVVVCLLGALGALASVGCGESVRTEGPVVLGGENVFITSRGEEAVPAVQRYLDLEAFFLDPEGGERIPLAVERDEDRVTIPDAPPGEVYLKFGDSFFVVTERRDIDIGRAFHGPAEVEIPNTLPHSMGVEVSGLRPWQENDELHLYVPDAGFFLSNLQWGLLDIRSEISPGDVETQHLTAARDWTFLKAIEEDDEAHVYQLSQVEIDGFTPWTNVRGNLASSLTWAMALRLEAELEEPVESSFQVSFPDPEDGEEAPEVGVGALKNIAEFHLFALPGGLQHGHYGRGASLIKSQTFAAGDVLDVVVPYRNPFPGDWGLVAGVVRWRYMDYATGSPRRLFAYNWHYDTAERLDGAMIAPVVSPPRNIRVEGMPVSADIEIDVRTPVLAWDPPDLGEPSYYRVDVYVQEGLHFFGHLITTSHRVVIPEELVQHDLLVFRVQAIQSGVDSSIRPLASGFPNAGAQALTRVVFVTAE